MNGRVKRVGDQMASGPSSAPLNPAAKVTDMDREEPEPETGALWSTEHFAVEVWVGGGGVR